MAALLTSADNDYDLGDIELLLEVLILSMFLLSKQLKKKQDLIKVVFFLKAINK